MIKYVCNLVLDKRYLICQKQNKIHQEKFVNFVSMWKMFKTPYLETDEAPLMYILGQQYCTLHGNRGSMSGWVEI